MFARKKKGQINGVFVGLTAAVMAFLVLVIAISLTGQILGTQENLQLAAAVTNSQINESLVGNVSKVDHSYTLGNDNNIDNLTERVTNGTGNVTDLLTRGTHYSFYTNGSLTLEAGPNVEGNLVYNISYNYTVVSTTVASNISGSGLAGTGNIGDLVPTMGLVAGIFALLSLLGVLVLMFGPRLVGGE